MNGLCDAPALRLIAVSSVLMVLLAACTGTEAAGPSPGGPARAEAPAAGGRTGAPVVDARARSRSGSDLALPARAAFLYPWFPSAWAQRGSDPAAHHTPALGRYDSSAAQTTAQQLAWARGARLDAFISSWWGQGHHTDVALAAKMTAAVGDALKWAVYYEPEGQGDPTVAEIVDDLRYLEREYFRRANYARIRGAPVVFVHNAGEDGGQQDVLDRWAEAEAIFGTSLYVNLKVFPDFRAAEPQPDSWHQYAPAERFGSHEPYAAYASPGFHHFADSAPRLRRDRRAFADAVRKMDAAPVDWKLIQTWNEWGEGTAIEPAAEWNTAYLDIVGESAGVGTAPAPTPSPPLPAVASASAERGGDVVFGLAGDIGGREDRAGVVLAAAADEGARWFGALGDMSYSEITPEPAWCDWIRSRFAGPFQIVAGNHEEDGGPDGDIRRFARCLPDRMRSTPGPGGYAANYFFDDGPVRMIMLSAGLSIGGRSYDFTTGSAERAWLVDAIRTAPGWVVVGMHKVCLTMGDKSCEVGDDLFDLLHAEGVDLTVHGHDHTYQRTHALSCSDPEAYRAGCVSDDGTDGRYRRGAGTVHVIVGTVGRSLYGCDHGDPEQGYFAAHFCDEEDGEAKGYVLVRATADRLRLAYRNVAGEAFDDRFTIE